MPSSISVAAPRDLVLQLPAPVSRDQTFELMRQADLVVATGSQTNVKAAYSSGTPAVGVGVGNVVVIVDETADVADAAGKIARSKTFDHATSCSVRRIASSRFRELPIRCSQALIAQGGVVLTAAEATQLETAMFGRGKLAADFIAPAGGSDRQARWPYATGAL
jgi:sulfoacetaldehyde dehydrogenase